MYLIPEIETVLILVPRTGSGSLRRAVAERYPAAKMIYRHMEACGVPKGYDRWRKVGIVRNPLDRLWSLYKFMASYQNDEHDPAYVQSMNDSASIPFSDWIIGNQTVFTSPYDSAGLGRFFPEYTVNHPLPENRKSQFVYLRPDLGTQIFQYDNLMHFADTLDIKLGIHNETGKLEIPKISLKAGDHINRFFAWDLQQMRQNCSFD